MDTPPGAAGAQDERDVLIVGSGIAALWLLGRLRTLGYRATLLTDAPLIDPADLAGRGLLATADPALQPAWDGFLSGASAPDLRSSLTETTGVFELDLRSRLQRLRDRLLGRDRGATRQLAFGRVPAELQGLARHGRLGARTESLLDVTRLGRALLADAGTGVLACEHGTLDVLRSGGAVTGISAGGTPLHARRIVLCDGGRHTRLRQRLGLRVAPLRTQAFLLLRLPALPSLQLHLRAADAGASFLLTTHATAAGERLWMIGADGQASAPRIDSVRDTLAVLLPELDWPRAAWQTWSAELARPAQAARKGARALLAEPAAAHARVIDTGVVTLAEVPRLVQRIIALLPPPQRNAGGEPETAHSEPAFLPPPWSTLPG